MMITFDCFHAHTLIHLDCVYAICIDCVYAHRPT